MTDMSKFKDSTGRWLTQSLFVETSYGNKNSTPMYTMKDYDLDSIPSFTKMWLEIGDPTGWRQAHELLGGWDHWEALMRSEWFTEYAEGLMRKLEIKQLSDALLQLNLLKDKGNYQAAAFIAKQDHKRSRRGPGRPTKKEVAEQARVIAESEKLLQDEAKRLGIKLK